MKTKYGLFLLLATAIFACKQHNATENSNQMVFNVDTNLVSNPYYDTALKIEFRAPKSMVYIDFKNKDEFSKDTNKIKGLLYYFVDTTDNKSAFMMYDIRKADRNQINQTLMNPALFFGILLFMIVLPFKNIIYTN
jgi:hypothetical protein